MLHEIVCFVWVSHLPHIELDYERRIERLLTYQLLKYNHMVDATMSDWKPKEVKAFKYLYFSRGVL